MSKKQRGRPRKNPETSTTTQVTIEDSEPFNVSERKRRKLSGTQSKQPTVHVNVESFNNELENGYTGSAFEPHAIESEVNITDSDYNTFPEGNEHVDHSVSSISITEPVLSLENEDIIGGKEPPIESQSRELTPSEKEEKRVRDLLESFPHLRFKTLCFGKIFSHEDIIDPYWKIKKKGELKDDEKRLLIHINKILQSPSCVDICEALADASLRRYASKAVEYVCFMATRIADVNDFVVDGNHLSECVIDYIEKNGNFRGEKTIEAFQNGGALLHRCLATYKAENSLDPNERRRLEQSKGIVPNRNKLNRLIERRAKGYEQDSPKKHHNRLTREQYNRRYTLKHFHEMNAYFLEQSFSGKTGVDQRKSIYDAVNGRVEIQLGHYGLLRGDSKRKFEWADIIYVDEETNRGIIPALLLRLAPDKTHPSGSRANYVGVIRHKEPEMCVVNTLSFSLWYRFDFGFLHAPNSGDQLPNFLDKTWYDLKILFTDSKKSRENCPISYSKEHELFAMALKSVGLKSSKFTHIGRVAGAQIPQANGASRSVIPLEYDWANVARTYGLSNSFDSMHVSAGFMLDERYRIVRDVEVPFDVQKQIFPWLEEVEEKVNSRTDQEEKPWHERDSQIEFFLKMLRRFRRIIPQDAAVLSIRYPNSFFWKHPMFQTSSFLEFREDILNKLKADEAKLFSDSSEDVESFSEAIQSELRNIKQGLDKGLDQASRDSASLSTLVNDQISRMSRSVDESIKSHDTRQIRGQKYLESSFRTLAQGLEKQDNISTKMEAQIRELKADLLKLKADMREIKQLIKAIYKLIRNKTDPSFDSEEPVSIVTVQPPTESPEPDMEPVMIWQMPLEPTPENIDMDRKSISTVPRLLDKWYNSREDIYSFNMRERKWGSSWLVKDKHFHNRMKKLINLIEEGLKMVHKDEKLTRDDMGKILDEYRRSESISVNQLSERRKDKLLESINNILRVKEIRCD